MKITVNTGVVALSLAAAGLAPPVSAQTVKGKEPNRGGDMAVTARDPAYALEQLVPAQGYQVNLWASEVEFPALDNPVAFAWDARGRLWIATMSSYPQYDPGTRNSRGKLGPDDRILILEDTDHDGVADKQIVFAEGLHVPTGIELGDGGAYVAQQPNVVFLKDTDGDDVADVRRTVLHGFGTEDSHHAISAFTWGPGGGLYFQEGTFHHSQVETPWGPVRCVNAGVFRYEPTTEKFQVFVSYQFANPWGHIFDRWGQSFVADASGGANYYATAFSGHVDYPRKHARLKQFTLTTVRPTAGCDFVSSRHFPPEAQGNFLLNNCIGFHGVKQYTVTESGSGFVARETDPLLFSKDINFRPVDLEFGPDGALYLCDWFNPLIGHMQYSLRDERRDHSHGRIWRITAVGRPLLERVEIAGQPIAQLLELLESYEDRTRYRARLELRNHDPDEVAAALREWVTKLDSTDDDYEHHKLEALWVHQHLDDLNPELLDDLLNAKQFRARAAATRVLQYWRDRIPGALDKIAARARDEAPRVRLEAVRACSFFASADAARVALEIVKHPRDDYLDYTLAETLVTLKPHWKPALVAGKDIAPGNPLGMAAVLDTVNAGELVEFARTPAVCDALLRRSGIERKYRVEALDALATAKGTEPLTELIAVMTQPGGEGGDASGDLVVLLVGWDVAELSAAQASLETLARGGESMAAREAAYACLVNAGLGARAWENASRSLRGVRDFLGAVARIENSEARAALYSTVRPLLRELPDHLRAAAAERRDVVGRYVRIELPRRGTLTLAEVEVFSGSDNVARLGVAKQSSVAWSGHPVKAIDGNTDGAWGSGASTHTRENQPNPWWEVNLGRDVPIHSIRIWNRTDGDLGARLRGFTVSILDSDRAKVFVLEGNPAPASQVEISVSEGAVSSVRRAAIDAIGHIPGHESEKFVDLLAFVAEPAYRDAAVAALMECEQAQWPHVDARKLALDIVSYLVEIPLEQRKGPLFSDSVALARRVADLLPAEEAAPIRDALGNLDSIVVHIKALPSVMRYDKTQFTVAAGKPVEIVFENPDLMPHNLLISVPGSLVEVGMAADKMAQSPEGFAKSFIPDSEKVLWATGLLQPKQKTKLRFVAPEKPGDYPYICTFPGHWRTMNGVMKVVKP